MFYIPYLDQPFSTFTLVSWWEISQWNSQRYLPVNRSSAHLPPIGSHLYNITKPPPAHKMTNSLCSSQLLPGKWLSPPIICTATCTCPKTTDYHPWKLCLTSLECAQHTHHDNKIWKSWHRGHPCHPRLSSPGCCTSWTPYARGRQWIIWWMLWRNWHLPPLGWTIGTVLAT